MMYLVIQCFRDESLLISSGRFLTVALFSSWESLLSIPFSPVLFLLNLFCFTFKMMARGLDVSVIMNCWVLNFGVCVPQNLKGQFPCYFLKWKRCSQSAFLVWFQITWNAIWFERQCLSSCLPKGGFDYHFAGIVAG